MSELPSGSQASNMAFDADLNAKLKKNHLHWMEGRPEEALKVIK